MNGHATTLTGKNTNLEVGNCDSVEELKTRIQEKEGIPQDEQRLDFAGRELNGSSLHLVSREATQDQVFVKTLHGYTIPFTVKSSDTVRTLKAMLEARKDILIDDQRLVFGGKQLEDGRTLADYGIHNGSALHLVLRHRGGAFY